MRKIIYSVLFVSLTFTSCINKMKSGIQTSESEEKTVETGSWELSDVADEFGDFTGEKCLRLMGKGTYSSELENNEQLTAIMFVYQDYTIKMRLLKKGAKLVDDFSGHIKIKDGDGNLHEISFTNDDLGQILPFWDKKNELHGEGKMEFRKIIQKEGVMSAIAEERGFMNINKTTYHFKFNLNGFNNAMRYLLLNEGRATNQYNNPEFNDDELSSDDESESVDDELDPETESEIAEKIKFEVNELESENIESDSHNTTITEKEDNSTIYNGADEMPQFPGGPQAVFEYLSKSIRYPTDAKENGVQGKVLCSFVIERDGSISNVIVVKSIHPSLDKEAKRVISSMPDWIPGKQNGNFVRVRYTLPVTFSLQ